MKTILLVEDEPNLTEILDMVFSEEGYNVYRMQRAEDALEFCLVTTPDLIISDIQLGGMDGLALLKVVRGMGRLHRVPFVVVSAMNDASFVKIAKEFGATAYFSKPFDIEELVGVVNKLVSPQVEYEKAIPLWPA